MDRKTKREAKLYIAVVVEHEGRKGTHFVLREHATAIETEDDVVVGRTSEVTVIEAFALADCPVASDAVHRINSWVKKYRIDGVSVTAKILAGHRKIAIPPWIKVIDLSTA